MSKFSRANAIDLLYLLALDCQLSLRDKYCNMGFCVDSAFREKI